MKKSFIFFMLSISSSGLFCVDKQNNMTQSQAHISVPSINKKRQKWFPFTNKFYKKIFDQVVKKEIQFNKTHYVFYNASDNQWRVPQDLYLKLYQKLHPLTMDINDFRAFRWLPVDHITPERYIKQTMIKYGMINDNDWAVKTYLLSTNLALFGNVGTKGECTFNYFLEQQSNTSVNQEVYEGILDIFDNPVGYKKGEDPVLYKYLSEIAKLEKYLVADKGPGGKRPQTLNQIFIPQNIVDDVAYIAWVKGAPYEQKMVNWVQKTSKRRHTRPVSEIDNIRHLFKDKATEHPLFKEILEGVEQGKYAISPLIDQYKKNPKEIPSLNHLQARLIVSPEYIGNPSMDVKVFDYDTVSSKNKQAYEKALDAVVEKIFKSVLDRAKKLSEQPRTLNVKEKQETQKEIEQVLTYLTEKAKGLDFSDPRNILFVAEAFGSNDPKTVLLIQSILEGNTSKIKQLLAMNNFKSTTAGEKKVPLLLLAIAKNNQLITKALLEYGMRPNDLYYSAIPGRSLSAIEFALLKNNAGMVRLLIENGAIVDKQVQELAGKLGRTKLLSVKK